MPHPAELISILTATAPIHLLIALGWLAVRSRWIAAAELRVLGRFASQICVPALLFNAIASRPLRAVLQADYLAAYAGGSAIAFGAVFGWVRLRQRRRLSVAAIQALGASCSNSGFIGYPVALQVVGTAAGAALALNVLIENLLVIPLALALADADREHGEPPSRVFATALGGLCRNPMVIAIAAGTLLSASGLALPEFVVRALGMTGAAAPPVALFVIGGSLVGLRLDGMREDIARVVAAKLLLHPLAVLALMLALPNLDPVLKTAGALFASVPMLSIYPVLAQRSGLERFSAAALLAATLASFASATAWIALLASGLLPLAAPAALR